MKHKDLYTNFKDENLFIVKLILYIALIALFIPVGIIRFIRFIFSLEKY